VGGDVKVVKFGMRGGGEVLLVGRLNEISLMCRCFLVWHNQVRALLIANRRGCWGMPLDITLAPLGKNRNSHLTHPDVTQPLKRSP
jgi:hypothetical protein